MKFAKQFYDLIQSISTATGSRTKKDYQQDLRNIDELLNCASEFGKVMNDFSTLNWEIRRSENVVEHNDLPNLVIDNGNDYKIFQPNLLVKITSKKNLFLKYKPKLILERYKPRNKRKNRNNEYERVKAGFRKEVIKNNFNPYNRINEFEIFDNENELNIEMAGYFKFTIKTNEIDFNPIGALKLMNGSARSAFQIFRLVLMVEVEGKKIKKFSPAFKIRVENDGESRNAFFGIENI